MKFDNLHEGLVDCNCRDQEGVRPDTTNHFARLLRRAADDERTYSCAVSLLPKSALWPNVKPWCRPQEFPKRPPIVEMDFDSHHEIPIEPFKELMTCADHCGHRGVSINMLRDSNFERIRNRYRSLRKNSKARIFGDFLCVFKLSATAGLVWCDKPSDRLQHHNLLKADGFSRQDLILIRLEQID